MSSALESADVFGSSFSRMSHAQLGATGFLSETLASSLTYPDLHPQRTRSITSDGAGKFVDITGSPFGRNHITKCQECQALLCVILPKQDFGIALAMCVASVLPEWEVTFPC